LVNLLIAKEVIQMKCLLYLSAGLVCTATLLVACGLGDYPSPQGYRLDKPQKSELGKSLNEISGIAYNQADTSLLAISDSKKKVFEISLKKQKLQDFTDNVVPADQDLEDLEVVGGQVYLLSSKGLIYKVPAHAKDTTGVSGYELNVQGQNDFETLYYDPSVNGLIMICKSCSFEKGKHTRTAFRFDLDTKTFDSTAFYTISTDDVKKLMKNDNAKFDPSAAAINPLNKRLYILSSAGNLLVVTDTKGKVIEAYNLNPDEHPQAEGIAFAPNGDMYITNEGKYGKPTLQVFRYQNGKKK
jgi:uncharacterized protein YjiK